MLFNHLNCVFERLQILGVADVGSLTPDKQHSLCLVHGEVFVALAVEGVNDSLDRLQ